MAIAYRSVSTLASGTRTSSTVPMPAGVAAGDEVRIVLGAGRAGSSAPAITPTTSGVTLVASVDYGTGSEWWVRLSTYRYRVVGSGDPAGFAFTTVSATTDGWATAFSGVDPTTPDDASPTSIAGSYTSAQSVPIPSLTTVTADTMLVATRGSWDGLTITPPAGWTEDGDQAVTWIGHMARPATGATGTVSIPSGQSSAGGISSPAAGILMALRPTTGSAIAGTLTGSSPAATAGVPTAGLSGAASIPVWAGSVDGSAPATTAGPPTAALTGTVTVPAGSGALDAAAPTAMAGPPTAALTATSSVPTYSGTLTASTPDATVGPPTASISGASSAPVWTGSLLTTTPGVTAGPPVASLTGVQIPAGGGILATTTPIITAGPPTAAITGTYAPPAAVAATLTASAPTILVGPPVATITGQTVAPIAHATLDATAPVITVAVPLAAWTGSQPGAARDITLTLHGPIGHPLRLVAGPTGHPLTLTGPEA